MSDINVTPFFVDSFVATVPGTTSPVTEFANGADIALSWQSNGTSFTVYAAQDAQPVYTGTAPACVVSGGRKKATTFVLAASVTGGPDSGTPNPGFETIFLYDALTVTIKNPDETPNSVTAGTLGVSGTSNLRGDATLGNATVNGALTVTGTSALNGGATASGLTVTGQASLQGNTTMGNATVNGTLGVTGPATLAAATLGTLTITGAMAMMAPRALTPGTWYTASSDGILVGAVWYPSDAGKKCCAQINGYSQGIGWVWATGGNTVVHQNTWGSTMWGNANTYAVPVQKGTGFTANVNQIPDKEMDAPTGFWWVPFGRNATLSELSAAEATALGISPPEPPPAPDSPDYDPTTAIAELVAVIKELAGGTLPANDEQELSDALRSLVMHQP